MTDKLWLIILESCGTKVLSQNIDWLDYSATNISAGRIPFRLDSFYHKSTQLYEIQFYVLAMSYMSLSSLSDVESISDLPFSESDFEKIGKLGEGYFSDVFLVQPYGQNQKYVRKQTKPGRDKAQVILCKSEPRTRTKPGLAKPRPNR